MLANEKLQTAPKWIHTKERSKKNNQEKKKRQSSPPAAPPSHLIVEIIPFSSFLFLFPLSTPPSFFLSFFFFFYTPFLFQPTTTTTNQSEAATTHFLIFFSLPGGFFSARPQRPHYYASLKESIIPSPKSNKPFRSASKPQGGFVSLFFLSSTQRLPSSISERKQKYHPFSTLYLHFHLHLTVD